jgi:hypothetical protein
LSQPPQDQLQDNYKAMMQVQVLAPRQPCPHPAKQVLVSQAQHQTQQVHLDIQTSDHGTTVVEVHTVDTTTADISGEWAEADGSKDKDVITGKDASSNA